MGTAQTNIVNVYQQNPPRTLNVVYPDDNQSVEIPNSVCPIWNNDFLNAKIVRERAYLDSNARDRSASKGYGFGKVTTDNHFDSAYIESNLNGFADDFYFTPAVYSYILGFALPSLSYSRVFQGAQPADPNGGFFNLLNFADYDGGSQVRFTTTIPEWSNLPYTGDVGDWQSVPGLANSTHRCWNWGRPDICWEYLNRLGFDSNLIGPRPGDPAEEENQNE